MSRINFSELEKIENLGAATGWVSPLSAEDKEFIKYFRSVFKRYNIDPSKATRLEYDFVTRWLKASSISSRPTHSLIL